MTEAEREAIQKEVEKLKVNVHCLEEILSGKREREISSVIAGLGHGNNPFPTVEVALDWKRDHRAQVHGGREVEPWDCDECTWLEAVYYTAARKANVWPLDDPVAPGR